MAALLMQLQQLHKDLHQLAERDPEQEIQEPALKTIDAVVAEARANLPPGSTLAEHIIELISADTISQGNPIRVVDAALVVGQLLAVFQNAENERRAAHNASIRLPRPGNRR